MACTRRTVGDTHLSLSSGLVARHQGHQLTPHVHQLLRRREAHLHAWMAPARGERAVQTRVLARRLPHTTHTFRYLRFRPDKWLFCARHASEAAHPSPRVARRVRAPG